VYLQVNRRQFQCDNCQNPFSEKLDFVASKRTYTKRLAKNILEQLKEGDILNVSRSNDVTEEEIQRMLEDIAEKITYQDLSKLRFFVTWYGSIGGHKSTKSLSGKRLN
jgi:transposase